MGLRKKQIRMLLLLLIFILLYSAWTINNSQSQLSNEDFIRFHVIANSDSKEDQQLKLKVRDGILAKINNELVQEAMSQELVAYQNPASQSPAYEDLTENNSRVQLNLDESRKYIMKNLAQIETTAEKIVSENGYAYSVKAELGVKWIPQKTYGEIVFPSGNYETLNLTIGEGQGHNWWCVLFPPLCLIGLEPDEDENPEVIQEIQEIYNDILLDDKYDPLMREYDEPTTLKLKFKTLELIDKIK